MKTAETGREREQARSRLAAGGSGNQEMREDSCGIKKAELKGLCDHFGYCR